MAYGNPHTTLTGQAGKAEKALRNRKAQIDATLRNVDVSKSHSATKKKKKAKGLTPMKGRPTMDQMRSGNY